MQVDGAVFDLPEDVAKDLLSKPTRPGDVIDVPKQSHLVGTASKAADGGTATSF
jgi:hypothetical protein